MNNMKKLHRTGALLMGPLLFILCYFCLPSAVFTTASARAAIGTVAWMAFWWITGPIDYAVTAFLPIALNALFQMTDMSAVITNYASETILLLLGASILTASWQETGLDQRIAAKFLSMVGSNLRFQLIFWFLLCAGLSAILPNAVVCATVTPIAVSMLNFVGEKEISKSRVGSLLLLTIAYATGVGGLASPLGGSKEYFMEQYRSMPKMSKEEKISLMLFVLATVLSFTRQLYQNLFPGLKPAYVFIICAICSFLITDQEGGRLMRWKSAQEKIVWELMYVFAGGLAVGTLISNSGAADNIGALVAGSNLTGGFTTVLVIVTLTVLLSDVTSNTATAAVAIPIVIGITQGIGKNPIPYVYIASIGVNLSYMLPTSIRAIPVGYGLEPKYMLKKGIPITIVVILLMSVLGWLLMEFWPAFSTI